MLPARRGRARDRRRRPGAQLVGAICAQFCAIFETLPPLQGAPLITGELKNVKASGCRTSALTTAPATDELFIASQAVTFTKVDGTQNKYEGQTTLKGQTFDVAVDNQVLSFTQNALSGEQPIVCDQEAYGPQADNSNPIGSELNEAPAGNCVVDTSGPAPPPPPGGIGAGGPPPPPPPPGVGRRLFEAVGLFEGRALQATQAQCEGATTEAGCNAIPGCLWSTGLDGGAIAGIIIALLVGFCCIGACVFFVMKKPAGKGGAPPPPPGGMGMTPMPPQMPPNWTQIKDPNSGQPYYYNNATGVTQWTMPTA